MIEDLARAGGGPRIAFSEPLEPMTASPALAAVHQGWRALTTQTAITSASAGQGRRAPLAKRLQRRVRSWMFDEADAAPREGQLQLLAELIHTVDALARRCDELSERCFEVLAIVSDDLTNLRALLSSGEAGRNDGAGNDEPPERPH